ncbi:MAG: YeiH family protein [Ruminiclostridium sp.]
MTFIKKNVPGIFICALIAGFATFLGSLNFGGFSMELIGAPVISILTGMIISLVAPKFADNSKISGGVKFTSKKILQYAVIILGFTLNLGMIAQVGTKSLPVIICTISISLIVSFLLMKLMKIDPKTACLIGVGSSICGGSAIAATAPVIDADDEDVARSISVIFLFNILAALIFPAFGQAIGLGTEGFAVFAGTAVNDTSSVTAAAATAENLYHTSGILSAAVTVKLTRTLAIIPITLVLAFYRAKKAKTTGANGFSFKKIFPWFILWFVGASLLTTIVGILPESAVTAAYSDMFVPAMKWLAKFFIAMAMSAIGLGTNIVNLIKKGGKPIILGFCCWCLITAVSIGVQLATGIFYSNL